MTRDMQLIGVRPRVQHSRASLLRLQHEVEYAIENTSEKVFTMQLDQSLSDIVECIAIVTAIAERVAPVVQDSGRAEQLRALAEFYKGYHEVPR